MSLAQEMSELLYAQLPPPGLWYPQGYPTAKTIDVYCKEDAIVERQTIKRHFAFTSFLLHEVSILRAAPSLEDAARWTLTYLKSDFNQVSITSR